jgi:hypothetical protein
VYVQVLDEQGAGDGSAGLSRAGAGDRVVRAAARTWEQSLAMTDRVLSELACQPGRVILVIEDLHELNSA